MMGSHRWRPSPSQLFSTLILSLQCSAYGFYIFTEEPYSVSLTGTHRAVIDSELEFTANLLNGTTPPDISTTLIYMWSSDACQKTLLSPLCHFETFGITSSHLMVNLTRYDVGSADQYRMMVDVYDITKLEKSLATGSINFVLTNTLNGKMEVTQSTAVNHAGNVFSTAKPVSLHATLSDKLSSLQQYNCTWVLVGTANYSLHSNSTSARLLVPLRGNYKVFGEIHALLKVRDRKNVLHDVWRNGNFETEAKFEDPVSQLKFEGNKSYVAEQNLTAKLYCNGSSPFFFNVTLCGPNNTTLLWEEVESSHCEFSVRRNNLSIPGTYLLIYQVTNSVGMELGRASISVAPPPAPPISDLVPVFAVIIGLLAPSIIIYVYLKEHSGKRSIESANFSFRPSVFERDTYTNIVAKLKKCKWKRFFCKKEKKVKYREMLAATCSVSASELEPSISPTSDTSRQSGFSQGSAATSSRCGTSGSDSRCTSSLPWLEQSSEHSGRDQYSSMWLLQSPLSSNAGINFGSSTDSGSDVRLPEMPVKERSPNYGSISFA